MPGQGCPRGPLCSSQNNFASALWLGRLAQRALIIVITFSALVLQIPSVHGQQNQFSNDLFQAESIQLERRGTRRSSAINLRKSTRRNLRKNQPIPFLARRRVFALQRLEPGQITAHPRLAEVIKSRDSLYLVAGDWQAMTFERDTGGLFQAFGQLPDRQFNDVPHPTFANLESLPLAVRQSQSDHELYFYLANASPWHLQVRLRLSEEASEQTIKKIKSLSPLKLDFKTDDTDAKVLTIDLAPYDLLGGWVPESGPIESYSFKYVNDVASDLRKRVFALQVKLQQAQQIGSLRILSNPKFLASESKEPNREPIHGWEIGEQSTSRFQLLQHAADKNALADRQSSKETNKSTDDVEKPMETYLQIRSSVDAVTWIRSQPILSTETGRLSISVWLRSFSGVAGETAAVPEIRMAIDGQTPTGDYYRFGAVGRESAGPLTSLGTHWKRFAVHFDDLPCSLTDLRIGFDVVGKGVVEVGDVELFDRWFDSGDAQRITQLLASADAMLRHPAQFDRCRRLLAEPWAEFLDDHFSLKPTPRSAQQPVPMFRPKVAQTSKPNTTGKAKQDASEQQANESKAGQSLKR